MCKAEPKFWFIPKYVLVLPKFCGINQNDLDKIKMLVCVKMNLNFGSYQNIFWSDPDRVVFYFENTSQFSALNIQKFGFYPNHFG